MKEFLIAMIVVAALLMSFREPSGAREISDFESFASLCLHAGERIVQ